MEQLNNAANNSSPNNTELPQNNPSTSLLRKNLIVIIVCIFLIVALSMSMFLLINSDKTKQQNTNRSSSSLLRAAYKIYYNSSEGFISQLSNGANREVLFNEPMLDFELIDNNVKALLITDERIVLFNLQNKESTPLITYAEGKINRGLCCKSSLSPSKQYYIFERANWSQVVPGKGIAKDYFIIDLIQKSYDQLDFLKENIDFDQVEDILWNKDSERVLFITYFRDTRAPKPHPSDPRLSLDHQNINKFIEYEIKTKKIYYLGEQDTTYRDYSKPLAVPVFANQDEYDFSMTRDYYSTSVSVHKNYSPDKTKLAEVKNSALVVNGEEVYSWKVNSSKQFIGPPVVEDYVIKWLSDSDHIIFARNYEIRIIQVSAKKVSLLEKVDNSKISGKGRLKIEVAL